MLKDSCAPEDPELATFLDRVERLRDPTHVLSLTQREWREVLADAGFTIDRSELYRKERAIEAWLDRAGTASEARDTVLGAFRIRLRGGAAAL